MEDREFRRLLDLFPVVRTRDYNANSELSRESTSHLAKDEQFVQSQDACGEENKQKTEIQGINYEDPFWEKLRLAAERKVGAVEAEKFCKAFQMVHKKLVYEELSLDAAQRIVKSANSSLQ